MIKSFVYFNLSNGIEWLEDGGIRGDFPRFVRIPSTWLEQHLYDDVLFTLSDDLLLNLALGERCVICDCGANKEISRSIYQGIEWIKFVLNLRWMNREYSPIGRVQSSKWYFWNRYHKLTKRVKRKIDYYKDFVNVKNVDVPNLIGLSKISNLDGNKKALVNMVKTYLGGRN